AAAARHWRGRCHPRTAPDGSPGRSRRPRWPPRRGSSWPGRTAAAVPAKRSGIAALLLVTAALLLVTAALLLVAAAAEAGEDILADVDGALGRALDHADERVGAAVPRLAVRLRGVLDLLGDRRAGVVGAALVVAAQDTPVGAIGRPALQLDEPHHGERVRAGQQ